MEHRVPTLVPARCAEQLQPWSGAGVILDSGPQGFPELNRGCGSQKQTTPWALQIQTQCCSFLKHVIIFGKTTLLRAHQPLGVNRFTRGKNIQRFCFAVFSLDSSATHTHSYTERNSHNSSPHSKSTGELLSVSGSAGPGPWVGSRPINAAGLHTAAPGPQTACRCGLALKRPVRTQITWAELLT